MNPAGVPRKFTFAGEDVRRIPFVLALFLLISLIAHASAFFLFQIVYPPQSSIAAPQPPLTVLDERRPDHQALLRWIDAEDPAPAASGAINITDRLLEVKYRPSFATMRTAPLTAPEPPATILFPPARDPLSIIRSVEAKPEPPPKPPASNPTRLVFSPELADRVPEELPPLTVNAKVDTAVDVPEFLIGVTDRGEIRFVFPQRPSADPGLVPISADPDLMADSKTLDSEASDQLSRIKLKPGTPELAWGRVRIEWGPEIYQEKAPDDKTPARKSRP